MFKLIVLGGNRCGTCTPKFKKVVNITQRSLGFNCPIEAGCSQEEGPKKGFVMGSRTQGVQEILEKCM